MRFLAAFALLWPSIALAEQPRGTYTLDRDSLTHMTDAGGKDYPSCGGEKLFGGQATFVIEYGERILVNRREWRFKGHTIDPSTMTPRSDSLVIIDDPESKDRITIWFGIDKDGDGGGVLQVRGSRNGKVCFDAWWLRGKYVQ